MYSSPDLVGEHLVVDDDLRHARDRPGDDVLEARVGRRGHGHASPPRSESPTVIQRTCAVIASVLAWLGANSTVAITAPLSADPRQGVADELVHAPACRRTPSPPAPCPAAPSAPLRSRRPPRRPATRAAPRARRPRARRPTTATNTPSLATCIGSIPRISAAPATAGCTGHRRLADDIATPEARASSLSTDATPPRVASRRQRRPGPAAPEQRVDGGPQAARVRADLGAELELAAGEHDRRPVLADRPRHEDAVARAAARPGRASARGSRRPMPVVQMYIWSACPRSTTFVSPAMICTPAARRRRRAIASTSSRSTVGVEALLEDQRRASARAAARRPSRGR